MAETTAKPRRRRWPWLLLALALLGAIGAFALYRYTRVERLTALLLEQARTQFGLDLTVAGNAGFGFVPKLHLLLPKPSLKAADGILLEADSIEAMVPWRSLWSDRIEIERIDIRRPQLDFDALSRWLAARPAGGAAPDVRFALAVHDASLLASGKTIASGLNLQFANGGDLAAWLAQVRAANASLLPPLSGSAQAEAVQIGATRIEGLRIEARENDAEPSP